MRRGLQWVCGLCKQLLKQRRTWHELNSSLWLGNKWFPIRGLDHTGTSSRLCGRCIKFLIKLQRLLRTQRPAGLRKKSTIITGQIVWICHAGVSSCAQLFVGYMNLNMKLHLLETSLQSPLWRTPACYFCLLPNRTAVRNTKIAAGIGDKTKKDKQKGRKWCDT